MDRNHSRSDLSWIKINYSRKIKNKNLFLLFCNLIDIFKALFAFKRQLTYCNVIFRNGVNFSYEIRRDLVLNAYKRGFFTVKKTIFIYMLTLFLFLSWIFFKLSLIKSFHFCKIFSNSSKVMTWRVLKNLEIAFNFHWLAAFVII